MEHKLTIGVSNKSPKSRVVTYKKVSPEMKVHIIIFMFVRIVTVKLPFKTCRCCRCKGVQCIKSVVCRHKRTTCLIQT